MEEWDGGDSWGESGRHVAVVDLSCICREKGNKYVAGLFD